MTIILIIWAITLIAFFSLLTMLKSSSNKAKENFNAEFDRTYVNKKEFYNKEIDELNSVFDI